MTSNDVNDDDFFRAAVSCSIRRGRLKSRADADPERSRATEQTFVLVNMDGRVIDRLPLQMVEREAVKLQDTYLPDITRWLGGPREESLGGGRKPSEEDVARTVTGAIRAAGSAFRVLLFLALLVVSLVVTTFIPIIGGLMLFALALVALTAR